MRRVLLSLLIPATLLQLAPAESDGSQVLPIQQSKSDMIAGTHRAICYSGFRSGQHPDRGNGAVNPSDQEILEDLKIISGKANFELIRLYDSQINSEAVLRLIKENKLNIKVMLGAWLDAEINNPHCPWMKEPYSKEKIAGNILANRAEVDRAIRLAKQYPKIVVAVAVGNEALVDWNDHMVPLESVIAYVRKVKKAIEQPVTVADNYEWWAKHGAELAKEIDFVSVHIYPIWEEKDIDAAMDYSIANMQAVRQALPDSRLVITEAGWATIASEFGKRASEEKQARYFREIFEWSKEMNITTFFFEAFDEDWKGDPNNPLGAEKHWGIYNIDRKPKLIMKP
jgi:exo-beta-1,3-glucanase (GH17 family)